jgi:putative selenate reductase molybdopterin-binding subunit
MLVSPYPHARVLNIDLSKAEKLPGVKAVLTWKDMPDRLYGLFIQDERPLAKEKVRYVGDRIAAVAAIDEETAQEALSLIAVDYEELPAVLDPLDAMKSDAPQIHDAERNIATSGKILAGNPEQGFRESDLIFEHTFETSRVQHCCIQTLATLASFESGKLTLWPTTQSPFGVRNVLSGVFGMPEHKIRVIQSYLGGGFGERGTDASHLDLCASALSMKTGRPVKMIFSRKEEFENTKTRLREIIHLRTGVKKDGTMIARQMDMVCDNGAYTKISPVTAWWGGLMFGALYRIPNMQVDWRLVYTNHVPAGAMRGNGNPQITFAGESQIDTIAEELGIDPMDFRLKNVVRVNDKTAFGPFLKSCGLLECINKAAERIDWKRKKMDKGPHRGVGMACQVHCSGARWHPQVDADFSAARIKLNEDGTVNLALGVGDLGTGSNTIMAQITAEVLGVEVEDVEVMAGDTEITPQSIGVGASRYTVIGGNAVRGAAQKIKRQLFEIVANKLEASTEDLVARDRYISVKGSPDKKMHISQAVRESIYHKGGQSVVAEFHYDGKGELPSAETGCGDVSTSYSFACQVAEVEVDPDTGKTEILKIVAAHDVGKIINPMLAEGQVEGGVAMGVGYALTEDLIYRNGNLLNGNFRDYKVLTAQDIPPVESIFVETSDPEGPFGAKGLAEPCTIPTAPAIANAIYDAIKVRIKTLPITPEKILAELKRKREERKS